MSPPTDFPEEDVSVSFADPIPQHPLPNRTKSILLYLLIFYFIAFGLIQIATNLNYSSAESSLACTALICSGTISTPEALSTHYIYLKEWRSIQKDMMSAVYSVRCHPYCTNEQIGKTVSYTNTSLLPSATAFPSGRYESQYPQGVLSLQNAEGTVPIDQSDLTVLFSNPSPSPSLAWADTSSQVYGQWREESVSLDLVKLWGVAQISGRYTVTLEVKEGTPASIGIEVSNGKSLSGHNIPLTVISMLFAAVLGVLSPIYSSYLTRDRIVDANQDPTNHLDSHILSNYPTELKEDKAQDRTEESVVRIIVNPRIKKTSKGSLDTLFAEVQALRQQIQEEKVE